MYTRFSYLSCFIGYFKRYNSELLSLSKFKSSVRNIFNGGAEVKASTSNVGDLGLIPGSGRSPGEGNETHFSILAWRISWMEKPGRLQSMGSQRVRHD